MIKRMILMLLAFTLVIGGILGFKYMNAVMTKKFMSSMGIPPQTISTTKAASEEWQSTLAAVGSLRAVNGADLSSEVSGIVSAIHFESGTDVDKDAVLVELRDDDDIAKLHTLEASATLADITYQRDIKQLKLQAVSQAVVDNDLATLDGSKAQVAEQQAIVAKKTIRAPFSGHLGIRQVDLGEYLNPGSSIATLQQLDPIYVDFTLPEQALTAISLGQKVTATTDAYAGIQFDGEVLAINSKVDEATRNVQVRATFKNPDHKLLPGMYAKVLIATGKPEKHITLPQTAISFNPYGNTVFLINNDDPQKPVAKQTFVTTGDTRGDQIAILDGIKEGDQIVTSGQMKLRNGVPVIVNNELQPTNDSNPKPRDDQ